ncbi:ABC transporter permease [Virgisporangium ochraceum]|uniref:Transport permease protein n=1 Tax=Virgisporangium ochraceum TaxID=65505 RepID=A0A8J4EE18_9ACTN|nr:ABC transporter permease [Virgisporangium ochraceum]GIJ71158.1 transport permease protein [Virgisporangium ochraceum]
MTMVLEDSFRARARWAVVDCWTVVIQELTHLARQPSTFAWQLGFPIVTVLLFVYVFGSAMDVSGQGAGAGYLEYAMPGMFTMTMAFGFMNTAFAVAMAKEQGFIDRFRSMPMAPSAVVTGRGAADILHATVDLMILAVIAVVLGWRPGGDPAATLGAFALLLWLRLALIFVGIWIGLLVKNTEAAGNLFALAFPFGMISSVFTPPDLMPAWLGAIAAWNPVSSTADAIRDLFASPPVSSGYWIQDHATVAAVVWPAVIVAVFVPLAVRRYQALGR